MVGTCFIIYRWKKRLGLIGDSVKIVSSALESGILRRGLVSSIGGISVWLLPRRRKGCMMVTPVVIFNQIVGKRRVQQTINVQILGDERVIALIILSPGSIYELRSFDSLTG